MKMKTRRCSAAKSATRFRKIKALALAKKVWRFMCLNSTYGKLAPKNYLYV